MMALVALVAFLALSAASARPLGSDPRTWSQQVQNETETPDKCTACKVIVGFVENTQKICTVVPKSMEALCEQLVQQYPPDVLCKDLCVKTKTYEIHV